MKKIFRSVHSMNIKKSVLLSFLFWFCTTSQAFVLWGGLEHGDSIQKFQDKYPNAMKPAGRDYWVDEQNPVVIAGMSFIPYFIFDKQGQLQSIELSTNTRKTTYGDYILIANLLEKKYGKSLSERIDGEPSNDDVHSFTEKIWVLDSLQVRVTRNVVTFMSKVIAKDISVQYRKSDLKDASKL